MSYCTDSHDQTTTYVLQASSALGCTYGEEQKGK